MIVSARIQGRNIFIIPKANNGTKPLSTTKFLAGPPPPEAAFVGAAAPLAVVLAPIFMLELSADVAPLGRTVEDISMDDGMVVIVIEGSMSVDDIIIEGSMAVDEELCASALLARRRAESMIALNRMMDCLSSSMTSFRFNLGPGRVQWRDGNIEVRITDPRSGKNQAFK